MSALKSCPFCGGCEVISRGFAGNQLWRGQCRSCESCGPVRLDEEAAIAAWNRRAGDDEIAALRAEVERLREALRPFADAADWPWDETIWRGADPAEAKVLWSEQAKQGITRGHFNAARAALEDRT